MSYKSFRIFYQFKFVILLFDPCVRVVMENTGYSKNNKHHYKQRAVNLKFFVYN